MTTTRNPSAAVQTVCDELIPLADKAARLPRGTGDHARSLLACVDSAFARHRNIELLVLAPEDWEGHPDWPDLVSVLGGPQVLRVSFYQQPWHWLRHMPHTPAETPYDRSNDHPQRPDPPSGQVYRRFDPQLGRSFSLRVIDPDQDFARFVRWMNLPRIAEFWEQAWSETELADFIQQRLSDPHTIPLIGEFDGQPFGYFEVYWAPEDRIAPYYAAAPFDRGLHLLVGEEDYRGGSFVDAWLAGLQHYAYLAEPRTARIVLEPRHDNHRLFRHLARLGLERVREFDFPHKRATLVMGRRELFFQEVL